MGKSFRRERTGWDDDEWSFNSRNQRDARKMAKAERNARKTRRNFDDRTQVVDDDED